MNAIQMIETMSTQLLPNATQIRIFRKISDVKRSPPPLPGSHDPSGDILKNKMLCHYSKNHEKVLQLINMLLANLSPEESYSFTNKAFENECQFLEIQCLISVKFLSLNE